MIFLTSDLHFNHDREFIYKPRGFNSIEEMNNSIVERWNSVVSADDDVYVLGDLMLGQDSDRGLKLIESLNGHLHIIIGNHDTDNRIEKYKACSNVTQISIADRFTYKKYHFYLSHFPTLTGNLQRESLHQMTLNLFGHTHSKELFYNDMPFMYNVACDAHDCMPVSLDTIIEDMKNKVEECKSFL